MEMGFMGITLESFYNNHWKYYLVLEKDFLKTQRYVEIDLGGDTSYITNTKGTNIGNSRTFSIEYLKQYQCRRFCQRKCGKFPYRFQCKVLLRYLYKP